jgi:multisubunit Na+/H+ antiporter MnhF subunit
MNEWEIAAALLGSGLLICCAVCVRAGIADAVVALEVAGTLLSTILMVLSEGLQRQPFADLAVTMAVLSLLGALIVVRMLEACGNAAWQKRPSPWSGKPPPAPPGGTPRRPALDEARADAAAPLRRRAGRRCPSPLGGSSAAAKRCHLQRSRRATAAAIPMAPTSASDPGASSGGPMTML